MKLRNFTAVFKNTDNMTTVRCRRFVGVSVTVYQTARSMILKDVSRRNRGEQRDDDICIIPIGVNTPNSLERTQVFSVLFPPAGKFATWIRNLKVVVRKVRAEKHGP